MTLPASLETSTSEQYLLICPEPRSTEAIAVLGGTPFERRRLLDARVMLTFEASGDLIAALRAAGFNPQVNGRFELSAGLQVGDSTPHGLAEYADEVEPGVFLYGTNSHGGYWLSPDVNARIPAYARAERGFYERDAAAAIPAYFLPFNGGRNQEIALEYLRAFHADIVSHPDFPCAGPA
ncbi:DUF7007 domain-containing protein [Deinococcus soli (ex Cha et al. 2016)]|uniref:DUF7007 domain-containing protein n=2 Tax=Deinococcus soli (ex Cha et al. 2016) TaxID=1309411 RepID=A0AAE3XB76_9DEIO|nr:hypothetical protein [Deinococcus soli (ex Cha et al. 2016)]MDR6218565.1 hypothetical protein [Deinococcus soli (ex Cha et al. 2016)]MDR6328362.1 hypothetical protein [Deinococcus soli (ex Cha et al. 2016)]MDR6752973.1 hypothetical protein [Deinococcus soli (ex Cha et al. 2016)]